MGFVRTSGGGYASASPSIARWLLPLPASASFAEGAAFPMAFLDGMDPAHASSCGSASARASSCTAAAGAVGTAAVQIVRALNGRPVAAVGSAEKLELPRSLGADEAVTYDALAELEPSTSSSTSSGATSSARRSACSSRWDRRSRSGYAGGLWEDVSPAWLVGRNIGVQGFYLGRLHALRPDLVERAAQDVLRLWEGGIVRPIVGQSFRSSRRVRRTG